MKLVSFVRTEQSTAAARLASGQHRALGWALPHLVRGSRSGGRRRGAPSRTRGLPKLAPHPRRPGWAEARLSGFALIPLIPRRLCSSAENPIDKVSNEYT